MNLYIMTRQEIDDCKKIHETEIERKNFAKSMRSFCVIVLSQTPTTNCIRSNL